jgi:O-antigen ligase
MKLKKTLFFLICALAFSVSLENFFEKTIGLDTPVNPYRICTLLIIAILIYLNGSKGLKIDKINYLIFWVFVWGIIIGILRYFVKEVEFSLLIVNFILFAMNFFMFIALYNTSLHSGEIRAIFVCYNLGLFLNLALIQTTADPAQNPNVDYVRESGFFTNPNNLALACVFGLITSFYLFHIERKLWIRTFAIVSMLNSLFLIDYSASRAGAIVATFIILLLLIWYFMTSRRAGGKVVILASLLLIFFYYENFSINAVERQNSREARNVKEERDILSAAGIAAFTDSNFMGLGLGQFKFIGNFYSIVHPISPGIAQERLRKNEGLVTHNSYIQVLAEAGLIGFLLLLLFYYNKLRQIVRNYSLNTNVFFFQICTLLVLIVYGYAHVIFLSPVMWFFLAFIFPLQHYEYPERQA